MPSDVGGPITTMVALTGQWWLDEGKPKRKIVTANLVNLIWNGLKDLRKDPSEA